jgi:hypothetical protein
MKHRTIQRIGAPYPLRLLAMMLWYDWVDLCRALWLRMWRHVAGVLVCLAVLCVVVAMAFAFLSCSGVSPRTAANASAIAAQESRPILRADWIAEGNACVDVSASQELSDACTVKLDRDWQPVFDAYNTYYSAYELFRKSYERGGVPSLDEIVGPYCDLRTLAAHWYELPDFPMPGHSCPVADGGAP